jgi:hypothetical protein
VENVGRYVGYGVSSWIFATGILLSFICWMHQLKLPGVIDALSPADTTLWKSRTTVFPEALAMLIAVGMLYA